MTLLYLMEPEFHVGALESNISLLLHVGFRIAGRFNLSGTSKALETSSATLPDCPSARPPRDCEPNTTT
jgi:hypothetical protein